MILEQTDINDVILITPRVYKDERGYFMESYNQKKVDKLIKDKFVQDNESLSNKNVLRGLHLQVPPYAQAKLIRVIKGSILDVAVDLRQSSSTFGKHFKHMLSGENKKQLYIPKGFAHGFLSLEDGTILNYKCSDYYHAESESSIIWNDPDLSIDWGILDPILAEKDRLAENFATFENPF
ncbi:dTDP-4-dehydrorhamnose 3,5-epimerase [Lutimonas sp.]|jgi:dTDP-4-dehydrorhamnose 3,5-epimerase|uniref:dTDP-4-dehydrorhamnose 3,5-epimerase n=1 Tax=Lutimonas sp. TaxID=1872403 RepID=UPI003C734C7E